MREVPSTVKATVAAIAVFACALAAPPVLDASASASPTLVLAAGTPASGGPGAAVSYSYTWDYNDCQTNSKESDPSHLTIELAWDDNATTPIGNATVTVNAAAKACGGTVTGKVPANATAGDHFPQAYLVDPARGFEVVPNSNSGKVSPGQQFTVVLTPTATPTPAPTPTPTDTPLPTDTPTTLPTPTVTGAVSTPSTTATTGGSGPSKALLAGIAVIVVIAAALAGTLLVRRRRARANAADPFEFLR